jgi:hypothetical protein
VKNNILGLLLTLLVLLSSCGEGYIPRLARNDTLPFDETPVAKSFLEERVIFLQWSEDVGAESYKLYRDLTPLGAFSECIYEGSDLSYKDENLTAETRYFYKLAKKKGTYEYDKSDYSFGVAASSIRDSFEENDTRKDSIQLMNDTTANIYYYEDGNGKTISDIDWYCYTVPAQMTATFQVNMTGGHTSNSLELAINFDPPNVMTSGQIDLVNNLNESQTFYLCFVPNGPQFTTGAGGQVVGYSIELTALIPN